MATSKPDQAWNNFVFNSHPELHERGSERWAAALACRYMGQVNNGGLNSFLTAEWDLDAGEVRDALTIVGAQEAALQLDQVLAGLGVPLPAMSQDERWNLLEEHWKDGLDQIDILSEASDRSLMKALEEHVARNQDFYLGLERKRAND